MQAGPVTPWNTLRDHQRYASSLVLRQAAAPRLSWSPDMSSVTCEGRTLALYRLRAGIRKITESIQERMKRLTRNTEIPVTVPAELSENLADDKAGTSWLQLGRFTPKELPLLEILLSHPDYTLAHVDSFGVFRWNHPGLHKLRHDLSELASELAVLCFLTPAPPPRGTEFADTRITNAQIPRNVYKDHGTWFIHHRTKTSGLTESLSWVPTLCPETVSTLLDWYLVVARPIECIISQVLDGEVDHALHNEFLWMMNGKQLDSEQFSHILERTTGAFMGVGLSLHYWRHIAVSLMREFIPPTSLADNFGDKSMNHNTAMARRMYAREAGQLPFLTTDAMLESRQFCEAWHNVLGVGKADIPIPLRLIGYQQNPYVVGEAPIPIAAPAPHDAGAIAAVVSAAVNNSIQGLRVDLEGFIQAAVANGIAAAMRMQQRPDAPVQPMAAHQNPVDVPQPHATPIQTPPTNQPVNRMASELSYATPTPEQDKDNDVDMLDNEVLVPPSDYVLSPPPESHWHLPASSAEPTQLVSSAVERAPAVNSTDTRQLLCATLKDNRAIFTSKYQGELISLSLSRDRNVIGILPTGGGKSMCYEVPATAYRNHVSIVFVPFVAVILDQLRRATERGIKAAKYSSNVQPSNDLQLLFVSWEHAADQRLHK